MNKTYNILIEEVKKLTREEKEDLKFLVEKYLIEERRLEIFNNYQESKKEVKEKRLEFSNDLTKLKETL